MLLQLSKTGFVIAAGLALCCFLHWQTDFAIAQQLDIQVREAINEGEDPLGLSAVRDDYWLVADDNKAYYNLLNRARQTPLEELETAAREFRAQRLTESKLPQFVDMIRHSKKYIGQPVTMRGHILQTLEYKADENPFGIEQLYESMLYTDDSQAHPTTVVFLEKPENLPLGGELVNGVTVSGYFLKVYWYPSSDNATRKSPLILAHTLHVQPISLKGHSDINWVPFFTVGVFIALGLIATFAWLQRSDRRRMLAEQKRRLEQDASHFRVPGES